MSISVGGSVDVRIQVDGDGVDDVVALYAWLGGERALRGGVRMITAGIGREQLGALPEAVSVAVGAGGAGTVLASSLFTWLQSRRTKARITVEAAGRSVTLEIETLRDVRPLLEQILQSDDDA